jgi:hypothetical protein
MAAAAAAGGSKNGFTWLARYFPLRAYFWLNFYALRA